MPIKKIIPSFPVFHAGRKPVLHPRLGVEIAGQTAIAYLRFFEPVKLDRLELPLSVCGRWIPSVPTHPAHLLLSVFDRRGLRWKTIREVELPRNPAIAGRGLNQTMDIATMDALLVKEVRKAPHVIELGGLVTDCLRVECDREHPVWPNHGECNGGEFGVPFGLLKPLKAYGQPPRKVIRPQPYRPILTRRGLKPVAPKGMRLEQLPHALFFRGKKLSVGFSLARPLLLHLGWDCYGRGQAETNRLLASRAHCAVNIGGLSGPFLRTLDADVGERQWTGTVEARGNRVFYRNLHAGADLTLDAVFTVQQDEIRLELVQHCRRPLPALEAEAWRLVWNMGARITGSVSMPTQRPGRNGDVEWPLLFAGDGNGSLLCELEQGDPAGICLQTESYRDSKCRTAGFSLAPFPGPGRPIILPAGTRRAAIRLSLADLEPEATRAAPTPGVKRNWSSAFSAFRPELGGFSNNAISVNCHVNQGVTADMIVFTKRPKSGPDPLRLARFTLERALLDGGGYGYHRQLFLDSDPIVLSGIGRMHQLAPDLKWLERIRSGVVETSQRILSTIGEEGLAICRALSGNSRSFRWSSNAMDVVGYGHMDAYVNAWTYRALKNTVVLLNALGDAALSDRCREAALCLREAFPKYLVNPKTGWIAGWRSRDGRLHDYAFLWVNGPGLAFGLLPPAAARKALTGLERLREKVCPTSGYAGLPGNLLAIHPDDHMLPKYSPPNLPTFETYTDGSLVAVGMGYYLRALSIHGLRKRARALAKLLDWGFADGVFCGPYGSGPEFHTWDGLDSGYEGTFGPSFGLLYAVAVETGALRPPEPEWWPEA